MARTTQKFRIFLTVNLLLLNTTLFADVSASPEVSGASRHSTPVYIFGPDTSLELASTVEGFGPDGSILLTSRESTSKGQLFWSKNRERHDQLGNYHVFFRQYYSLPTAGAGFDETAITGGVWLVGAEVGLHYDKHGSLILVLGTHFEDVVLTTRPEIDNRTDASTLAWEQLFSSPEYISEVNPKGTMEFAVSKGSQPKLLLHSTGTPGHFQYVWETSFEAKDGTYLVATIDAETGELFQVEDRSIWSDCSPNSNDQDAAIGVPQNSDDIDDRSIWATETDDRGATYSHEAHKISSGTNPHIQIFMPSTDACSVDDDYSLIPIKTISGSPTFEHYASPDVIKADIAADAIFFTYKTMATFDSYGWDGWDDSGGDADVTVEGLCTANHYDHAGFLYNTDPDWAPSPGAVICPLDEGDFTAAAAIDIVAHEWGHGVIFESAGWTYSGDGAEFHEGYADVIGHAVEWHNQTSGSGAEKEDWLFGEDRSDDQSFSERRPDDDDGAGGLSFHADDASGSSSDPYQNGFPISVAHYLMSEGGENPVCDRDDTLDGCGDEVTDVGVDKASRILFYGLTNLASSSSGWNNLAYHAQWAAFDLYGNCPTSNAATEQTSAIEAFTAVGYPPAYSNLIPCF